MNENTQNHSVLFHGSPKDLLRITPQLGRCVLRDKTQMTPYVYAQPDLVIAHAYALKDKNRPSMMGGDPQTGVCRMIVTSEDSPWDQDLSTRDSRRGGFIYTLDADKFHHLPDRNEWVSEAEHNPREKKFIAVDDALTKGVQLLVLNGHKNYGQSQMWQAAAANRLESFLEEALNKGAINWLNQDRGLNPQWPIRNAPSRGHAKRNSPASCATPLPGG